MILIQCVSLKVSPGREKPYRDENKTNQNKQTIKNPSPKNLNQDRWDMVRSYVLDDLVGPGHLVE